MRCITVGCEGSKYGRYTIDIDPLSDGDNDVPSAAQRRHTPHSHKMREERGRVLAPIVVRYNGSGVWSSLVRTWVRLLEGRERMGRT